MNVWVRIYECVGDVRHLIVLKGKKNKMIFNIKSNNFFFVHITLNCWLIAFSFCFYFLTFKTVYGLTFICTWSKCTYPSFFLKVWLLLWRWLPKRSIIFIWVNFIKLYLNECKLHTFHVTLSIEEEAAMCTCSHYVYGAQHCPLSVQHSPFCLTLCIFTALLWPIRKTKYITHSH